MHEHLAQNFNMMNFNTIKILLILGLGGSKNRDQMARNWVKRVNITWTSTLPMFSHPSVQVSLGIDIVALRVTSKHTNATTILFTILCSVLPRYPSWQLFGNDRVLSQRETRLTEGRMLCAFAIWQIIKGNSWFFKPFCMSTWGKLEYHELPHYPRFLTPRFRWP